MKLQKTIKAEGRITGKGLFGGEDAKVVFRPAPEGTGVVFDDFDTGGLRWAISQALEWYASPARWRRLVTNGMREDFSWERQVQEYERLYAGLQTK